jgi:hypothetical protein
MMRSYLTFLFLVVLRAGTALGQGCELQLRVENQRGDLTNARIVLRSEAGDLEQRVKTQDGLARICDVGFRPFTLEVSEGENCPLVIIRDLRHFLHREIHLKIVLAECASAPMLAPTGCTALLRVRGESGTIPTEIEFHDLPGRENAVRGDVFGRVFFGLDYGQQARILVRARGYADAYVAASCLRGKPEVEQTVVMEKAR